MKKYPYISTTMNNLLFYAKDTATLIGDESNQFSHGFKLTVDESKCENNTHEYLSNTWGVVESKEHAEFIIDLAKLHGFDFGFEYKNAMSFEFSGGSLNLYQIQSDVFTPNQESKQITIPLPPKAKEWPQVGDEVFAIHDSGQSIKGELLAKTKEYAIIQQLGHEQHLYLNSWNLQKPKSKQDLLIEELQTKLCNNNAVDNYILACDIINGEIEGLSYE